MKFSSFHELGIVNLGSNPKEFGRIFAFVDYGNVRHWYEDQRRKSDGTRLKNFDVEITLDSLRSVKVGYIGKNFF